MTRLTIDAALALCERAALATGARPEAARSIAQAAVDAEMDGQPNVGLSHYLDYLASLREGRIDGQATPVITRPASAMIRSDARGGAAHTGFDLVFDDLVTAARSLGIALFAQGNAYTSGSLGYFARRLAERGLVAIAATNGPALMAGGGAKKPIYCTNPLAFAAPVTGGAPLVIDQASSATAFVSVRQAAAEGKTLPEGWALDPEGEPTTDPAQAMKGALLAFGGAKGGNIALMVEVLSAGIGGGKWSLDAGSIVEGSQSPGSGLTVIAIDPSLLDPGFAERLAAQLERLESGHGVHVPGRRKADMRSHALSHGIDVPEAIVEQVRRYAEA